MDGGLGTYQEGVRRVREGRVARLRGRRGIAAASPTSSLCRRLQRRARDAPQRLLRDATCDAPALELPREEDHRILPQPPYCDDGTRGQL